jgi:hypothetical protein
VNIPKTFAPNLLKEVGKPSLLKNGLPASYHKYVGFDIHFKTINYSVNNKMITTSANKQIKIYNELCSKLITKPLIIGIGSYPTNVGCLACAATLLYKFHDNNKTFNIITLSSLLNIPKELLNQEYAPEVVCVLDLVEDGTIFNIENARTLTRIFDNSVLVVPVVTKNIVEFFKNHLHQNASIYLQINSIKKVQEV